MNRTGASLNDNLEVSHYISGFAGGDRRLDQQFWLVHVQSARTVRGFHWSHNLDLAGSATACARWPSIDEKTPAASSRLVSSNGE